MVLEIEEWYAPALALGCALIGVTLAAAAFWPRRWPSVPGTIDISIYDTDLDGEGKKFFLSYSYTVGDRDYAGSYVSPSFLASVRPDKNNARIYREGMKVKVYYCPWAPGTSCLDHGSVGKSLALAAAIIGVAVWIWIAAR